MSKFFSSSILVQTDAFLKTHAERNMKKLILQHFFTRSNSVSPILQILIGMG